MKRDLKRFNASLSMYPKTTELISAFDDLYPERDENNELHLVHKYDVMYLKEFLKIQLSAPCMKKKYSIGFLIHRVDRLSNKRNEILDEIDIGYIMSDFKRSYYNRFFVSNTKDPLIEDVSSAILSRTMSEKRLQSDEIIDIKGFELYAQDSYTRNNPGYYALYGETNLYYCKQIVVNELGIVWDD